MGLLADIYVSRDDEALSYDSTPAKFAERAQYKRISPLELSMLWAIMCDIEWDLSSLDEFPCLLQVDGGDRAIHRLPAQMVTDLSRLTPARIAAVSPKWAVTEELGWSPDDAQPVVEDLVRLARRAAESGRNVYLWNCV